MIRINLLGVDRSKKKAAFSFDASQRVPLGAAAIVLLTVGGIGFWYWSLDRQEQALAAQISVAQQQAAALRPVIAEVQQFEARKTQLQQRVQLIEQLRGGQSVPVQILDHVSRSVPDMLWLTQLDQQKGEMTIEGRSTTLIALSDFVGNLGQTDLLQKPIEIVSSQVESVPAATPQQVATDVIKFTVKAQLKAQPEATVASAKPVVPVRPGAQGGAR